MARNLEFACAVHSDRHDCPDALVDYIAKFREYGLLIHDGGTSHVVIDWCPWCGTRLPESARDRWFDAIEALGLDPWTDDLPSEYQDERWLGAS